MTPLERINASDYDLNNFDAALDNLTPFMFAAKHGLTAYLNDKLSSLDNETKARLLAMSNPGGLTPLHFATRYGQLEAVRVLLTHGASPLAASMLGQLPIHSIFSQYNEEQTVQDIFNCLSEFTETVSIPNNDGDTVAHLAAQKGFVGVLSSIANLNQNILNKKSNQGTTPLLVAVLSNQPAAVDYLLTVAEKAHTDTRGRNALHYAVIYSTNEMLLKLIPHFSVDSRDAEGVTTLQHAINSKDQDKVRYLLEAGAHAEMPDANLQFP